MLVDVIIFDRKNKYGIKIMEGYGIGVFGGYWKYVKIVFYLGWK